MYAHLFYVKNYEEAPLGVWGRISYLCTLL